ncbi:neuronal acetylcholine receptor subunit beta-3-like [Pecten maximus]|uniref:neuronal acetylcholine receptor subunit beta-3-like n=1 Tax=Pecten maximus TaxID=6579 RepID=UPI001458A979|nr:neuronal acetylcholine receptor subunit beta-3-like [Pecten maximus]
MTSEGTLLALFLLASMINVTISSHTLQDVKDVYTHIFNGYDKRVIPLLKQGYSLPVYMEFILRSINEFDEKSQKLAIAGMFTITWIDESLKWNMSDFGYVWHVHVDAKSIWLPNIVLINTYDKFTMLAEAASTALVYYDGYVEWLSGDSYVVSCEVDITYYPFDTQKCYLLFEVWDAPVSEVALMKYSESLNMSLLQENVEWVLLKTEIFDSKTDNESYVSYVTYVMHLQRRPKFVISTIVAPVILLAFLNVCVFLIPSSSGEKNSFCVTVYLSYAVFLGIISSELPHNSQNVSFLAMYLLSLLIFSVIIVLITVIQVRLFIEYGETPVPTSLLKVCCFCTRGTRSQVTPLDDNDRVEHIGMGGDDKEVTHTYKNETLVCFKEVLPRLDVPLFFFFLIILILFTLVMGMYTYSNAL